MRLPRNKRDQIHLAWNFECAYCGEPLGRSGTLDHVIPKALGGSSKGHKDWITWFRTQHFWSDTREWAIVQWLQSRRLDP